MECRSFLSAASMGLFSVEVVDHHTAVQFPVGGAVVWHGWLCLSTCPGCDATAVNPCSIIYAFTASARRWLNTILDSAEPRSHVCPSTRYGIGRALLQCGDEFVQFRFPSGLITTLSKSNSIILQNLSVALRITAGISFLPSLEKDFPHHRFHPLRRTHLRRLPGSPAARGIGHLLQQILSRIAVPNVHGINA